jgi:hypothetical protein
VPFATVNRAWATASDESASVTATVMVCSPFAIVRVSNGRAVPSLLPPAKSHGALFSTWRGRPAIAGSSSQNRAFDPVLGEANA